MLWELDETGHYKPQMSLRSGTPATISSRYLMHSNGERTGDFERSLLSTTNSELVKLDLIITEEAPAAPLSLACKLQISVLSSKEEQEGR